MKVKIVEVGPRDGLQNEQKVLTLEQKKRFIELLIQAGHEFIEVGAFVREDKIPQMANTGELLMSLQKNLSGKVNLSVLVPNAKGFMLAQKANAKSISVFTAASETFNKNNINASIEESLENFKAFLPEAKKNKLFIRGYVSTCFGCPYEGKVSEKAVLNVTQKLLKLGVNEISIGDTIGVANPTQVKQLTKKLLKLVGHKKLALHFHDTRGTALANILSGLDAGVRIFDTSSGGLGGCPYAPGASGNVATEDVLYMLHEMGVKTKIDLNKASRAALYIQEVLGYKLPGKYLQSIKEIP
ncbi:MAG: hydroxymethylglutaryl-CoA lyase [Oligoflexia bacterium]|nr:hydroxymethylglutaryl-CoA lyase [Oligoflexia bacterium]